MEKLDEHVDEFLHNPNDQSSRNARSNANQSLVISDYVGSLQNTRDLNRGSVANINDVTDSSNSIISNFPTTLKEITKNQHKDPRYTETFGKFRLSIDKFTKKWNENPENRDKTVGVLKNLNQTKQEFV